MGCRPCARAAAWPTPPSSKSSDRSRPPGPTDKADIMNISGKVAIVTGGASGLGLATVRRLTSEGAKVLIIDLPSFDGKAVAEELGDDAVFVGTNVTDEDQVAEAVAAATALGDLAVAVNCAGIGGAIRTVSKKGPFPLADFRKVIEVNLI